MDWKLPGNESVTMGEILGEGNSRIAYEVVNDPALVIKENKKSGNFQNYSELRYWQACRQGSLAEFLCPIVNYSEDFRFLLMKRTTPVTDVDLKGVRNVFFKADLSVSDWGRYEGRVVCHDYSQDFELSESFSFLELGQRELFLLRRFFKVKLNVDFDTLIQSGSHPIDDDCYYVCDYLTSDIYITDGDQRYEKTNIRIDALKWLLKYLV